MRFVFAFSAHLHKVVQCTQLKPLRISIIHSGNFYSASSSPLLLRGAPDTSRILCRSFTPKRYMQLRVKDLPKVPRIRTCDSSDKMGRMYQLATTPNIHKCFNTYIYKLVPLTSPCFGVYRFCQYTIH